MSIKLIASIEGGRESDLRPDTRSIILQKWDVFQLRNVVACSGFLYRLFSENFHNKRGWVEISLTHTFLGRNNEIEKSNPLWN